MPDTRKPKATQRAAAEAERLQKELQAGTQTPTVALETKPDEEHPNKPADKAASAEEAGKDLEAQPSVSGESEELSADKPVDWEKRFKGLQTRYQAEVPKLRDELANAFSTVDDLRKDVTSLRAQQEEAAKPAPITEEPVEFELTAEEQEQYGEGWIGMMKRIAGHYSNPELAKQVVDLQRELADVKQGQKEVVEHVVVTDKRGFYLELARRIPDWQAINDDPEFMDFLHEEVGEYSDRKERNVHLKKAEREFNVAVVEKIFTDFRETKGAKPAGSSPKPSELDVPDDQIVPDTQSGGLPPVEQEKYWYTDEIDTFYRDKQRGRYKGKEVEAKEIEKDILLAGQQGRIVTRRRTG